MVVLDWVLILVVVEDVLVPATQQPAPQQPAPVLILVVVEDVLVHKKNIGSKGTKSLNPCCSGRCSSTSPTMFLTMGDRIVLILVVVEDVLVLIE